MKRETLVQERKRIESLQKLKAQGGPFTLAEEVDAYLSDLDENNKKEKQRRMKLEIRAMLGTRQHCCQKLTHCSRSERLI